jgi:ethanolamine ammonia-lyase small subunit
MPDDTRTECTDPLSSLRALTPARVGLGRTGTSLLTRQHLSLQAAHAQARSAVHRSLIVDVLIEGLDRRGIEWVRARSAAHDRDTYLQRPDLGRELARETREQLTQLAADWPRPDIVFVVADGLSADAIELHALGVLERVLEHLSSWIVAPVVIVEQGRVAISDEIGEILGAELAVILIGERPGLSSPDSLGIYLTYAPRVGNTDAQRNCISNIRDAGLSHAEAARRLAFLLREARRRRLSGIALKDESDIRSLDE